MPNTYACEIDDMRVNPDEGGLTNVVKIVKARYLADDGEGHTADLPLNVALGPPDPDNFIPFASLVQADVESWLVALTNVDALRQSLDETIAEQLYVSEACPWET